MKVGMNGHTEAGLVAASDENPPLLRLCSLGLNRRIQSVLPAAQSKDIHLFRAGLGLRSLDRVMSARVGQVGAKVAEEVLELSLVLVKGVLLGDREERQGQKDRRR